VLFERTEAGQLQLKPLFARVAGIFVGDQITMKVLERATFKSSNLIKGRYILDRANAVAKSFRKFYSVIFNYIDKETGAIKHSGKNWPEVISDFLDELHRLMTNEATVADSDDDDDDDEEAATVAATTSTTTAAASTTTKRKADWMPTGLLAFFCFGPFPWSKHQECKLGLFDKDPSGSSKKKQSRKHARDEKNAHEDFQRSRDSKRGKPAPTRAEELLEKMIQGKNDYTELMVVQTKLMTLTSRSQRLISLMNQYPPTSETHLTFAANLESVEAQIKVATDEMDKIFESKPSAADASKTTSNSNGLDDVRKELNPMEVCTPRQGVLDANKDKEDKSDEDA